MTTATLGKLALEELDLQLPLEVLKSCAGFYIGTCSEELGPVSRESAEYFKTQDEANTALATGSWTQRQQL